MTGVVALSAAQGTGKTELARALASELHGIHASVSSYLSMVLTEDGLEPTPHLLREHGQALARDPVELVRRVLSHYGWRRDVSLVFDSIRHHDVLVALRDAVSPLPVLHVALEIPETERQARLIVRNREPFDPKLSSHSTEVQVPMLLRTADLVLDGTQGIDQLSADVIDSITRR